MIKKAASDRPRQWHTLLKYALWDDQIRVKPALKILSFLLVYGQEPMLPLMLKLPTYQFMWNYMTEGNSKEARLLDILELQEARDQALQNFNKHQEVIKRWFDRRAKIKEFQIVDLILLWEKSHEKKGQHYKFDPLWMGLY